MCSIIVGGIILCDGEIAFADIGRERVEPDLFRREITGEIWKEDPVAGAVVDAGVYMRRSVKNAGEIGRGDIPSGKRFACGSGVGRHDRNYICGVGRDLKMDFDSAVTGVTV